MQSERENILTEKIAQMVIKWNSIRTTIRLYGSYHLYTKQAFKALFDFVLAAFTITDEFSIAKKKHDLVIVVDDWVMEGKYLRPLSVFESALAMKEDFERLNIDNITFYRGVEKEELTKLFEGLSKSLICLGSGGVDSFLETKGVSHIKVNQFKLDFSKEEEGTVLLMNVKGEESVKRIRRVYS